MIIIISKPKAFYDETVNHIFFSKNKLPIRYRQTSESGLAVKWILIAKHYICRMSTVSWDLKHIDGSVSSAAVFYGGGVPVPAARRTRVDATNSTRRVFIYTLPYFFLLLSRVRSMRQARRGSVRELQQHSYSY